MYLTFVIKQKWDQILVSTFTSSYIPWIHNSITLSFSFIIWEVKNITCILQDCFQDYG